MTRKTGRKLLTGLAGVVLSGVISYAVNHYLQERYRRITIARDTTYVTGPRFADGRIDFLSAVNQELSEGVTPENNAVVPLYMASGRFFEGWRLEAFEKAIGVKGAPNAEETYVDFATLMYERELKAARVPQEVKNLEYDIRKKWEGKEDECRRQAWKREEHPEVYEWLQRNKRALELVREAGRRERFFSPLIGRPDLGTTMLANEPAVSLPRKFTDLLAVDAMLALGAGDFAQCREDLLCMKRLGRHYMRSGSVMGCIMGIAVTEKADDTISASLKALPAAEARSLLRDLQALPPSADINDCLDQYERLGVIGEICKLAHFGPAAADIQDQDPLDPLPIPRSLGFQQPVHFDDLLREHNRLVDRRVAAGRTSPYSARKLALATFDADFRASKPSSGTTAAAIWMLIEMGTKASDRSSISQDRMIAHGRLTELALQLVIHRDEHGNYPKSLAEVKNAGDAAKDLFADDAPVQYVSESRTIYSVGPNQRDDKGVYDRPVDKRPLGQILLGGPAPVADYPDDISIKLP